VSVAVPEVDRPLVSVLMVTYGALEWVRRSVGALVEHTPPVYELVVVDNGSTDGTREWLRDELVGARVVLADENLGFGVGNDLAALHARGEHLCLLNSDAVVPPGWTALLEPLDDPGVGAVVPVYVYPGGRLQEAGAAVHDDGLVVALGAHGDPDAPAWRFPRTVQYGSAACLAMRRRTFRELGGFDPAFGTGYYEDVDLAFRLGAHGLRIVLDPRVRVVHAQGASSRTPQEAESARDANRERFRARWAARLAGRPRVFLARAPNHLLGGRDLDAPDRVLLTAPDATPDVEELLDAVVAAMPAARVTLALDAPRVTLARDGTGGLGDGPAEAWLARGVEVERVTDWVQWIADRRCHYSLVVTGPSAIGDAVREWQPVATVAGPDELRALGPQRLRSWLVERGFASAVPT
jgi:GT2 family glycosyltransferase